MEEGRGELIRKVHYGWWIAVGGMIIMCFATPLVTSLNSLYVLPITEEMKVSRSAYLMTSTLIAGSSILAAPLAGKILRPNNIKQVQTIATVVMALAYASYGLA